MRFWVLSIPVYLGRNWTGSCLVFGIVVRGVCVLKGRLWDRNSGEFPLLHSRFIFCLFLFAKNDPQLAI